MNAEDVEQGGSGFASPEVVSPQQLEDYPVGGLVLLPLGLVLADLVRNHPRRDAAMGQPR